MMLLLQSAGTSSIVTQLPFMIALIAVMYFFFIRPQSKKQKAQMEFDKGLHKGQKVVTGSGIIGTITKMDEKTVTLQISQKGFIDVVRSAISQEMSQGYESEK